MRSKKTIENLERWIKVIHQSTYFVVILEVVIVLIIGVASSNVTSADNSSFWLILLISLGIVYLVLSIIKFAYTKSFPLSIVNELTAEKDLELAESAIERKDAINRYISKTVIDLDKTSCNIIFPEEEQKEEGYWVKYSDKDFETQLTSVMKTFNDSLTVLLNTSNINFTTGVYVEHFRGFDKEGKQKGNRGVFTLRDDYNFKKDGKLKSLMTQTTVRNGALAIQNAIRNSFNNGEFYKNTFQYGKNEVMIICSNISDLKNPENQKGVFFIYTKKINSLPDDIESVLNMFSNLISHWLELYDYKLMQEQIKILTEKANEDIDKLSDKLASS